MNSKNSGLSREQTIVRTSIIGIIANVLLAAFKAAVGLLSNSIAVILDAVNNLSDALSSVITIIGTRLAGKLPDKKHPFGYGRIEYLSASIISMIVLYAGISSLVESVKKVIHPEKADYSAITLIIIAVAVAVKLILGRFVKSTGEKVNSDSLIASGSDAMFDSIISASTLLAAIIFITTKVSLEAYLGIIISIVIVKSGIEMLRDTLSKILGERVDGSLTKAIKKTVCETEGVQGAYDLILNDFGPDKYLASVHIEIPDTFTADKIDVITRQIQNNVYKKHNVFMTTIGIYSVNTKNDAASRMLQEIRSKVMSYEHILQMHGFYVNEEEKSVTFDMVMDFAEKDKKGLYAKICDELQQLYPQYSFNIAMDTDISD